MRQSVPGNSFATLRDVRCTLEVQGNQPIPCNAHARGAYRYATWRSPKNIYREHVALPFPPTPSFSLSLSLFTLASVSPICIGASRNCGASARINSYDWPTGFFRGLLAREKACARRAIKVSEVKYVYWLYNAVSKNLQNANTNFFILVHEILCCFKRI